MASAVKNPNDYALQVVAAAFKKWDSGQCSILTVLRRKVLRLWPSILQKFAGYFKLYVKAFR